MKKIKVVYFTVELTVGGAEKLILAMAKYLDRTRFEPIVVALKDHDRRRQDDMIPDFERAGIRVHVLQMRHRLDFSALGRFARFLREENPDILHTHLFFCDLYGRLVGRLCGVPVIVSTLHMLETPRHWWPIKALDRFSALFCDQLVAVSEEVKRGIVRVEGFKADKIQVIPNAIEFSPVIDPLERESRRKGLNLPDDAFLVGMTSRLDEPRKGHAVLFQALASLAKKWPRLYAVIIGQGPARESLKRKVENLGLQNRVFFLGNRNDVPSWLAAMDLFAIPSYLEGSPMGLIEAMASGLPIIATPVGGVPELVVHEESGLMVPPGDAGALGAAIESLMAFPSKARQLGEKARKRFCEEFDMRTAVRRTEGLYERWLEKKNSKRLKMLIVTSAFDTGGVTAYLANLIRRYPRDKFEISLASGPEGLRHDLVKELQIPYHSIPSLVKPVNPWKDLCAFFELHSLIRRERYDLVHTNMSKADMLGGLASRLAGTCVISTAHGTTCMSLGPSRAQRFFDTLEKWMYRFVHHGLISVSEATTRDLLEKGKATQNKVVTVPNAVDSERFQPCGRRKALRSQFLISENQRVVTMVARLRFPKSPEILIRAIRKIIGRFPEAVCLIVGDGPESDKLKTLVETLGLQNHVKLLGSREDVADILKLSDLFVLSTYSEGMSVSILEAMAAGLPVVASRVGGNPQLVSDGQNGLLVPPGDEEALARAIESLLADPVRRQTMSEAALRQIRRHFDASVQALRTQAALLGFWEKRNLRNEMPLKLRSRSRQFLAYLREAGAGRTAGRLLKFLIAPVYRQENLWFLKREDLEEVSPAEARIPCVIRKADIRDLDSLLNIVYEERQTIAQMLASEDETCFIAEHQGRVVAVQWVLLGGGKGIYISPFKCTIPLKASEAYVHDVRTLREFQRQGIMNAMQAEIRNFLADRDVRTVYTDIEEFNAASLAMFEKSGFRKFERMVFRRILGRSFAATAGASGAEGSLLKRRFKSGVKEAFRTLPKDSGRQRQPSALETHASREAF